MSLVCLSWAKSLQAFWCIIFRRGFLLGRQTCRPVWCSVWHMLWALTGWPPTPSTSAAMPATLIRSKDNLWIWCWAHALNFSGWPWIGPVLLNGTCPVKPLYNLGQCAAAQFQSVVNLPITWAIIMWRNNSFFSYPQTVICHEVPCWTYSDQYERVWER